MGNKQRILAIDYFRGICMLVIVVNHFMAFATPLVYLTGKGELWVSAAEMFFLLSGITYAIVRGRTLEVSLLRTVSKSFRRSAVLYGVHLGVLAFSVAIASLAVAKGLFVAMPAAAPAINGHLIWQSLTLGFSYGWADFLMFYVLFMLIAPFALKALRSRFWPIVPAASIGVFILSTVPANHCSVYLYFFIWQAYFFIGMSLARWRLEILGWVFGLPAATRKIGAYGIVAAASLVLVVSTVLTFQAAHALRSLLAAIHLPPAALEQWSASAAVWFQADRSGLLRLPVALLTLAAGYVLYQRFKAPLLRYTGWFVNPIGRNSLHVFVAQAILIPLLTMIPLQNRSLVLNATFNIALFGLLLMVAERRRVYRSAAALGVDAAVAWSALRHKYPAVDIAED